MGASVGFGSISIMSQKLGIPFHVNDGKSGAVNVGGAGGGAGVLLVNVIFGRFFEASGIIINAIKGALYIFTVFKVRDP